MNRRPAGWLAPMGAFFLGAVLVSAWGGPLLVGLLVGGIAAAAWHPLRRDPPWTLRGRAAWRARGRSVAQAARFGRTLLGRDGRVPSVRWDGSGDPRPTVDAEAAKDAARFDAAFPVRCEIVTPRLQVWHATQTGRAYEVSLRDGPADARAGDEGWLSFEGGRPRVRSAAVERLLN